MISPAINERIYELLHARLGHTTPRLATESLDLHAGDILEALQQNEPCDHSDLVDDLESAASNIEFVISSLRPPRHATNLAPHAKHQLCRGPP